MSTKAKEGGKRERQSSAKSGGEPSSQSTPKQLTSQAASPGPVTPKKTKAAPEAGSPPKAKAAPGASAGGKRKSIARKSISKAGGGAAAAAPPPETVAAPGKDEPVKHGRRAEAGSPAKEATKNGWMTDSKAPKVEDTILGKVQTIVDDVDENTANEHARRRQKAKEDLENKLAVAPTGYQAALPKLSELDITNTWDKLLLNIHKEYDMSCLTSCLAQELDEDAAWNPDMLLVQLTSELLDAQEKKAEQEPMSFMVVDEKDLGKLKGGEVRKRKEKDVKVSIKEGATAEGGDPKSPGKGAKPQKEAPSRSGSGTKKSNNSTPKKGGSTPKKRAAPPSASEGSADKRKK